VLLLSTVDKAVAFGSNPHRAQQTGDAPAYFAAKTALIGLPAGRITYYIT
jgi:hypothetical protein